MGIFAAIFGISFILEDSAPRHQAHHSGSHFTVMLRFSTAVFTLSRPTKAFQTDDSWNYSCRHPTNLIITSCTITVSSILQVIKAWSVCVCVCVRVFSGPWCLCLLCLESDALWFRCLFDSQFKNFLQTASPLSFVQRHFKSSLCSGKLESELFAVHSEWVFSWALPHTQLSPQHRNQSHKVGKKEAAAVSAKNSPGLVKFRLRYAGWQLRPLSVLTLKATELEQI